MNNLNLKQLTSILVLILVVLGLGISAGISYLSNQNQQVEISWNSFQSQYSEKSRLKNSLNAYLGYGGMIHQFKNLVLRKEHKRLEKVYSLLGAANQALDHYGNLTLSDSELTAINDIRTTINKYKIATHQIEKSITQGLTSNQIDDLVKVDDKLAFRGLDILRQENLRQQNLLGLGLNKSHQIGNLRTILGYGGMIHAFKNYVLRNEKKYEQAAIKSLKDASIAIDEYKSFGNIGESEKLALEDIKITIDNYASGIKTIRALFANGKSVEFVDSKVRVNDQLALRGLKLIDREINHQIEIQAQSVSTSLNNIKRTNKIMLVVVLISITALIFANIWIVIQRIGNPIKKMSIAMNNLARGNTEIQVSSYTGTNEIDEMGKAIAVFKENAIKRIEAEHSLNHVNEELQSQLTELRDMRKHGDEQTAKALSLAEGLASARDDALAASNRAEAEKERVRAIVDTVSDCIITISENGTIKTFNPAAEFIFGYKESEVINKNVDLLMPHGHREKHDSYIANYLTTGSGKIIDRIGAMAERRELIGQRKDGSKFPIELSIGLSEVQGETMFTGVIRDISKQKKIEQLKRNFVSSVSHELRTPLTAIKGSVGLIASGKIEKKVVDELISVTQRNIDRLSVLINDLLDFEKLESGTLEFSLQPVNVYDLISDTIVVNQHYATKTNVRFEAEDFIDALVNVDADRIHQVMSNLLSNAAKYSPENGVVKVGAIRKNNLIQLYVSDDGPGIPEEFRNKMFDRFTQVDSSDQKKKGGTGLGMAISKAIVEKHGGNINYHSQLGKGSTFYFELPEFFV